LSSKSSKKVVDNEIKKRNVVRTYVQKKGRKKKEKKINPHTLVFEDGKEIVDYVLDDI
jgi:hypothetical protein